MRPEAEELSGKRLLVTGGAGFLGSHLVEQLEKCEVVVVDDFSTTRGSYLPSWVKVVRVKAEDFRSDQGFDIVIHMAARPSPDDYVQHPVETMLSNSLGTYNMLEIARKNDSILLYTSTSEVYGSADLIPTPEAYWGRVNPVGVRSCYDESKRFSEALAMSYYREYGLDVRIERIFNAYGPRLRGEGSYGRVISRFILQALEGEDLTVHGDGMQTRAFLYVDDWVDATLRMLTCEKARGEVVNIGSGKETTILELASKIIAFTGSRSRIRFAQARPDDPRRRAADISKAKALLGWASKTSLDEGLWKTVEWFREALAHG
ncbi:MAG: GDP-mannose 4,6-dehydratase [Candidatus Bathyarchaeia archaeon]